MFIWDIYFLNNWFRFIFGIFLGIVKVCDVKVSFGIVFKIVGIYNYDLLMIFFMIGFNFIRGGIGGGLFLIIFGIGFGT